MRSASAQRVVLCKVAFFRRGCLADPLAPLCVQPEFCTLLTRHGTYPFFVHFCGLHMALVAVLCTRTAAVFSVWGMPLRLGSMLFLRINARAAPNIFLVHPSVFFHDLICEEENPISSSGRLLHRALVPDYLPLSLRLPGIVPRKLPLDTWPWSS